MSLYRSAKGVLRGEFASLESGALPWSCIAEEGAKLRNKKDQKMDERYKPQQVLYAVVGLGGGKYPGPAPCSFRCWVIAWQAAPAHCHPDTVFQVGRGEQAC